jgi:acetyl esterase/lipase
MRRRFLLSVVMLALVVAAGCLHAAPTPTAQLDVTYGQVGTTALKLDVWLPAGAGPFPAVVMIHGGGWEGGDKREFYGHIPNYLAQGVACFPISYRLSGQAQYPACVDDCCAAVRWVRAHAADYQVDPDRIAVLGGSAGGHLSLMVATAPTADTDVDSHGKKLKSLVVAAAGLDGPMDMTVLATYQATTPEEQRNLAYAQAVAKKLLGGTPQEAPDKYVAASPISRVTADTPPALLLYGTKDTLVPPAQQTAMADKLKAAGVSVEVVPLEGQNHGASGQYSNPQVMKFLLDHLKAPA